MTKWIVVEVLPEIRQWAWYSKQDAFDWINKHGDMDLTIRTTKRMVKQ